ncbi:hypothetical protein MT340_004685 [Staphylococcus sp. NRL 16/872]|uniref:hypothetical protein n=1 Tax=Staphylococcus sp. NRL 16/872 TaxID=2930131 RepID=UPI001FB201D6|nr:MULTISPECIES: hypothetical protein [unclassified Staphylococcus]MCJ1656017.1 hypothetical protein [Staphylococcus sp. NRL 21/187]MCJ1661807.1 hypothetical protein [Staphylococcus sp. NRL 18/288]MCJ1667756.1 hypothetical protein [Staphylococcus sp. NRL 19/737]WEN70247.1 hypothetical protein MT340_004685 [Staphylococcus sp. NRL 16/872]
MNYIDLYLNHFLKTINRQNINDYHIALDNKLKSIERYIAYLKTKKIQMNKLIDSLTATLENKYIDITNMYNIKSAQEINNCEIESLKRQLDMCEDYCARIEANIHRCSRECVSTQEQCDIIEQISVIA